MEGTVPDLVEALLACADTTRLRILHLLLSERELCVYDLVDVTGASQPKVSRHLAYLRRSGLVSYRKDGLWVYYRISADNAPPVAVLIDSLGSIFATVPELEVDLVTLDSLPSRKALVDGRYSAHEPQLSSAPPEVPDEAEAERSDPGPSVYDGDEDLDVELL